MEDPKSLRKTSLVPYIHPTICRIEALVVVKNQQPEVSQKKRGLGGKVVVDR